MANGCSGKTESAAADISVPFPTKYSMRPPPKALLFNKKMGKAGIMLASDMSIVEVMFSPATRKIKDTSMPKRGPVIEKSNKYLLLGGGDLNEVIAP